MCLINKYLPFILFSFIALLNVKCSKTAFSDFNKSSGNADFSNYISVGNSITQGYQDQGLYESTQQYSYPALIAQQMKLVNDSISDFKQPLADGNGSGYLHLEYINAEIELIYPDDAMYPGYGPSSSWDNFSDLKGQSFNNLGVAGIRLRDCIGLDQAENTINWATLSFNTFGGFLDWGSISSPVSYLDHVRSSSPSFFSCWMGNNDILGYAMNGAVEQSYNIPGIGDISISKITPISEFREKYDSILAALTKNGAKGICATIPNVTSIPYFTTVTSDLYDHDIYIETKSGDVRVATTNDLLLLSASSKIDELGGTSSSNPLESEYVIDVEEIIEVQSALIAFNTEIQTSAGYYGVAVVDIYSFFENMPSGITIDGITLTKKYIEGGAFSLDGVHPNPRGHAMLANEFIKAINDTYFSSIPLLTVGQYQGVIYP
ncbi:MAG TPA: hypothetical protein EYQ86_04315 [Bacteroidetes bacterium]|nr:hypothetical protein [Bacteroidota bacterium]